MENKKKKPVVKRIYNLVTKPKINKIIDEISKNISNLEFEIKQRYNKEETQKVAKEIKDKVCKAVYEIVKGYPVEKIKVDLELTFSMEDKIEINVLVNKDDKENEENKK